MRDSLRHANKKYSKVIIVFGPQCAGKSTFLSYFDCNNIVSLGEIIRDLPENDKLKLRIDVLNNSGEAFPTRLGFDLIEPYIKENHNCKIQIIDGYPRNKNELEFIVEQLGIDNIESFVCFYSDESTLLKRYNNRKNRLEGMKFYEKRYEQFVGAKTDFKEYADENGIKFFDVKT